MMRSKAVLRVLFWIVAACLFAPVVFVLFRADWHLQKFLPVPVKNLSANVLIEDGRWRASNVKLIRLDLRYSYSYEGRDYVSNLFSCDQFGGNEIMRRLYTEELNSELSRLAERLSSKKGLLAWVPENDPSKACLVRNDDFQYSD